MSQLTVASAHALHYEQETQDLVFLYLTHYSYGKGQ